MRNFSQSTFTHLVCNTVYLLFGTLALILTAGCPASSSIAPGDGDSLTKEHVSSSAEEIRQSKAPTNTKTPVIAPLDSEKKKTNSQPSQTQENTKKPEKAKTKIAEEEPWKIWTKQLEQKAKLKGIVRHEEKNISLWSDLSKAEISPYIPMLRQLRVLLDKEFEHTSIKKFNKNLHFQGYLIADRTPFAELKLLPKGKVTSEHGTYYKSTFWVRNQPVSYYTRHLLFHEFVHSYMMNRNALWPDAFIEGMAEHFATHTLHPDGRCEFGQFPHILENYSGLTRYQVIKSEVDAKRVLSLDDVFKLKGTAFPNSTLAYSWSWCSTAFLLGNPHTQTQFRRMWEPLSPTPFLKRFHAEFTDKEYAHIEQEWNLFLHQLVPGFETKLELIETPTINPVLITKTENHTVKANAGWQATGYKLMAGSTYRISASGSCILDTVPKPWRSEPQGVSVRYAHGIPIGTLIGAIYTTGNTPKEMTFINPVVIKRNSVFKCETSGELYLRINDFGNHVSPNTGSYEVNISP